MRRVWIVAAVFLSVLVIGLLAAAITVFMRPELMAPGPFHPRALYCRLLGYRVHPWIKMDPTKQYTLKVWGTRWPIFKDGYGYDDLIEEAVGEFQTTYPNVEVEYVLLPLDEIGQAIAQAVENSTPPNVCMAPFDPSLVASGFLVPLDVFMRGKEAGDVSADSFEPSALKSVSVNERVWAWPAWTAVESWAGNAQILREAGVDVEAVMIHGWSYDDVLGMVQSLAAREAGVEGRERTYGLVLDTASSGALDTLMTAAGSGLVLDPGGNLAWQGASLASALAFLDGVRKEKGFPEPVWGMEYQMLGLFWTGRAALIGPVGPGFGRHVRERLARVARGDLVRVPKGIEPVLLPVPRPPGRPGAPCVSVSAAAVFRTPGSHADDASLLAVRFAHALARKEALWLAGELPVVPAYLEDRRRALGAIGPDGASERFLLGAAATGRICRHVSPSLGDMERRIRELVLMPALAEFWRGTLDPAAFERLLATRAQEFLSVAERSR